VMTKGERESFHVADPQQGNGRVAKRPPDQGCARGKALLPLYNTTIPMLNGIE